MYPIITGSRRNRLRRKPTDPRVVLALNLIATVLLIAAIFAMLLTAVHLYTK